MLTSHQILWNLEAHSSAYNGSSTVPNLRQITLLHAIPSYFFKIHLCLDRPSGLLPSGFAPKPCMYRSSPPAHLIFLNMTNQIAPGEEHKA